MDKTTFDELCYLIGIKTTEQEEEVKKVLSDRPDLTNQLINSVNILKTVRLDAIQVKPIYFGPNIDALKMIAKKKVFDRYKGHIDTTMVISKERCDVSKLMQAQDDLILRLNVVQK